MNAIEVRELYKNYGATPALNELDILVPSGHIYGFLGPNGAGKTTTIKILLGLLKKDSGIVKIFGEEVNFGKIGENNKIGFVPEEFSLYGYMNGYEIINFNAAIYNKKVSEKINRLQDVFNIPLKRKISTYSRGLKKLLSLYVAISTEPDILILDEPTDGLDPVVRNKLLMFLVDEVANRNLTVFFSSHVLSEVEKISDMVGLIKNGKTVLEGDIDMIKENTVVITFKNTDGENPLKEKCSQVGEGIFQYKTYTNKKDVLLNLKNSNCEILTLESIPFEEIFMHYMEVNDESAN